MNGLRILCVAATLVLGLSACAGISRSRSSGYNGHLNPDAPEPDRPIAMPQMQTHDLDSDAREELGYGNRPLGADEREVLNQRLRLKHAESRIETKRERKQYWGLRSTLKDDLERIHFLSLPTFAARERWAAARGLTGAENHSEATARLIDAKDIAVGMSQRAVLESWGDPAAIEAAGNKLYAFERWRYNTFVPGDDGYNKQARLVYFEGGYVVGWERP